MPAGEQLGRVGVERAVPQRSRRAAPRRRAGVLDGERRRSSRRVPLHGSHAVTPRLAALLEAARILLGLGAVLGFAGVGAARLTGAIDGATYVVYAVSAFLACIASAALPERERDAFARRPDAFGARGAPSARGHRTRIQEAVPRVAKLIRRPLGSP